VLLGEPERTQADLNFVLFGIPVRIHPFFWLMCVLLGANLIHSPPDLLVWVLAALLSILIHELGHAAVMRAYGFRPWITLYGMGGLASYNQAQVYHSKGHGPLGQVAISAAGPGAGFLLTAVTAALVSLAGYHVDCELAAPYGLIVGSTEVIGRPWFDSFIQQLWFISVTWGLVNLLPVYPLDGGQIAREILVTFNPRDGVRHSLMLSILTATGMCIVGLVLWQSIFVGILFGYLAFMSYMTLQTISGRGPRW
jgi:stage IV sporulation protein FB